MANVKRYTVTQVEREKSLARMLAAQKTVKVGLTGGQKRALRRAQAPRKAHTAA